VKPKQWPAKIKRHRIPIYGGYLMVVKSLADQKAVLDFMGVEKDAPCKSDAGSTMFLTNSKGVAHFLVSVFSGGTQCLVHELAHVTFMVLNHAGVTETGNNEAHCYLLDALYAIATQKKS
jgi:hypothetical protein